MPPFEISSQLLTVHAFPIDFAPIASVKPAFAKDLIDLENHLVQSHPRSSDISDLKDDKKKWIGKKVFELFKELEQVEVKPIRSSLVSIEVPLKSEYISLAESCIGASPATNIRCQECQVECPDFSTLKAHYQSLHAFAWEPEAHERILKAIPDKHQRTSDSTLHFFCPIPGCKYHLLSSHQRKSFHSVKQLRQHYDKVHSSRSLTCPKCKSAFANDVYLKQHLKTACGRTFTCGSCGAAYTSYLSLQTHCRRKDHPVDPKYKQELNIKSHKGEGETFRVLDRHPGLIKLAPSTLHLNAAIALSELASTAAKVDVGIQTDLDHLKRVRPSNVKRKRTTETQTSRAAKVQKTTSEVQTVIDLLNTDSLLASTSFAATSTSFGTSTSFPPTSTSFGTSTSEFGTSPSFPSSSSFATSTEDLYPSLVSSDRPLWTVSSTQTSPSRPDGPPMGTPDGPLILDDDPLLEVKSRPPRLAEIEQFSTETQTDFDLLLAVETEYDTPFYMEAQTQFDLDDILCSNYTQTTSDFGGLFMMEEAKSESNGDSKGDSNNDVGSQAGGAKSHSETQTSYSNL